MSISDGTHVPHPQHFCLRAMKPDERRRMSYIIQMNDHNRAVANNRVRIMESIQLAELATRRK
jgi:hypothetical protein